jgi:hypothetical protein
MCGQQVHDTQTKLTVFFSSLIVSCSRYIQDSFKHKNRRRPWYKVRKGDEIWEWLGFMGPVNLCTFCEGGVLFGRHERKKVPEKISGSSSSLLAGGSLNAL